MKRGIPLGLILTVVLVVLPASSATSKPAIEKLVGKVRLPVLSYSVIQSGPADGSHPRRNDVIVVSYSVRSLSGRVIDSSVMRGHPDRFQLNKLVPAWQILVPRMRVGDIWIFYVPPEYAYGNTTRDGIPPNSFLVFEVELISFGPATPTEE